MDFNDVAANPIGAKRAMLLKWSLIPSCGSAELSLIRVGVRGMVAVATFDCALEIVKARSRRENNETALDMYYPQGSVAAGVSASSRDSDAAAALKVGCGSICRESAS